MTAKFLKKSQEIESQPMTKLTPSQLRDQQAREQLRTETAYTDVAHLFPSLDSLHKSALAKVVKDIFSRAKNGCSFSPFKVSPNNAITHPQFVVDWLQSQKAVIKDGISDKKVTLNSIAELSRISKGSLHGVNRGDQHLTLDNLEHWRIALAAIGQMNQDNEAVEPLSKVGDPKVFLNELLEQWRDLESPLPIERIREWADKYSGYEPGEIDTIVLAHTPTHIKFLESIVRIWRDEFNTGRLDNYMDKAHLLDVLQTRTSSRRTGRGFHNMIKSIHSDMAAFNSRIAYPKTHFQEYKRRYSSSSLETGVTSDILLGYCLFTGINPIAMLHWLAYKEATSPGSYEVQMHNTVQDLIVWKGTMSPIEYAKFHRAIHQMGLVSDQNRWALNLFSVNYVYHNLPTAESVEKKLGVDAFSIQTLVESLTDYVGLDHTVEFNKDEHKTLIGLAMAAEVNVFNAHRDLMCISLVSVGELNYSLRFQTDKASRDKVEAERNELETEEEFMAHMKAKLAQTKKASSESYKPIVKDEEGKVVAAESYRDDGPSNRVMNAYEFYKALADYFDDRFTSRN